jgi:hyaluronoglucosaminidase
MIAFLEDAGFNYYIYAPKVEPYHRQWWRRPYPEAELKNFAELAATSRAHNVTFNYGISPGLDFNFRDPAEAERLKAKLQSLFDAGVRAFTLCFDDIGPPGSSVKKRTATRQVKLVNEVYDFLKSLDPATELFFVPTVYSHTYSYWKKKGRGEAGYLEALAKLNPEVQIFWTGPGNVFSREITRDDTMELTRLWGRPALIWDNYPVNDIALRFNIFTGPYLGRSLDLGEAAGGIFLNPMYLPNASKLALYTAGQYMTKQDYDPWAAYERALRFVGGSESGYRSLKTLSDCLIPHPVFPELTVTRMPVFGAIEDLWSARSKGEGVEAAQSRLKELFKAFVRNPRDLESNLDRSELVPELMPASLKLALYGEAGLKCLEIMNERQPDRRTVLRREILELQARSRVIPWKVADETSGLSYSLIGITPGRRSVLDDFIDRALRENPL